MDRNELKQTAIDSMSACMRLMGEGDYAEAKQMAGQAWNCYFELQKTRFDDEDFTDLIYSARGFYEECEKKLQAEVEAEAAKADDEYAKLKEMAENGLSGDTASALNAAMEYLKPKHWTYFAAHDINFSLMAAKLLNVALKDEHPVTRGMAAITAAEMFRQPMHGNFDIDKSLYFARYAVTQLCDDEGMLPDACKEVIYAACCKGDIKLACEYAQIARDNGSDMSVFYEIASYGFRHNEKSAQQVEDQMYADGCWEGLLMHGQTLLSNLIESLDNPDESESEKLLEALEEYNRETLSKYADEHWGKTGGYSCAALSVYVEFVQSWEDILNNDEFMEFIREGAEAYVPWALYYLGCIYDLAADTIAENNPDDERIPKLRSDAFHNYALGAGIGSRDCVRCYLNMLKEAPEKNTVLIERYTEIARQLDVKVD